MVSNASSTRVYCFFSCCPCVLLLLGLHLVHDLYRCFNGALRCSVRKEQGIPEIAAMQLGLGDSQEFCFYYSGSFVL